MKLRALLVHVRVRGIHWTVLFLLNAVLIIVRDASNRSHRWIEKQMIRKETQEYLIGEATRSAHVFDAESNRRFYDKYDWSKGGEEWTGDVERYKGMDPAAWKQRLVDEVLKPSIPEGSVVVEIGPGAGRWTDILRKRCRILHIADVSQSCLDVCSKRFAACNNIQYHRIEHGLDFIEDNAVDRVWSYDVFVHINPTEIDMYLAEIHRVLKPGGKAVIHHSGNYHPEQAEQVAAARRSPMTNKFFAYLSERNQLEVLDQNEELAHFPGDTITTIGKKM